MRISAAARCARKRRGSVMSSEEDFDRLVKPEDMVAPKK